MKIASQIFLVTTLSLTASYAYGFSGAQLVDKCNVSLDDNPNKQNNAKMLELALDSGTCAGFVGGIIHGVNLVGSMLQKQGATTKNFICLPNGIHAKDLTRITLEHFRKNPADLKSPAQLGVFNAFTTKYPCPNDKAAKNRP